MAAPAMAKETLEKNRPIIANWYVRIPLLSGKIYNGYNHINHGKHDKYKLNTKCCNVHDAGNNLGYLLNVFQNTNPNLLQLLQSIQNQIQCQANAHGNVQTYYNNWGNKSKRPT